MTLRSGRSYSTREVAQRLGVSVQTVQRWVDAGRLRAWKTLGGHRRIDAVSAEQLFAAESARSAGTGASQPGAAPAGGAAAPASGGFRVLIVDDEPDDRALIEYMVRSAMPDVQIELAGSGFEGLVAIGRRVPDVLITDIAMPYMDGIEMLRTLFVQGEARVPVIVVASSHTPDEIARRGGLPSQARFIPKPIDRRLLAAVLVEARGTSDAF